MYNTLTYNLQHAIHKVCIRMCVCVCGCVYTCVCVGVGVGVCVITLRYAPRSCSTYVLHVYDTIT